MSELEKKLRAELSKLEMTYQQILKNRGYTDQARSIKIIEELLREQISDENTRRTTRPAR
jgi:hypothetical protein